MPPHVLIKHFTLNTNRCSNFFVLCQYVTGEGREPRQTAEKYLITIFPILKCVIAFCSDKGVNHITSFTLDKEILVSKVRRLCTGSM